MLKDDADEEANSTEIHYETQAIQMLFYEGGLLARVYDGESKKWVNSDVSAPAGMALAELYHPCGLDVQGPAELSMSFTVWDCSALGLDGFDTSEGFKG